jgi:hypothetical protein
MVLGCSRVGAEEGNQETGRNYGLYSPTVIGVITSRRMRWAAHVARWERERNACRAMQAMPIVM